MQEWLKTTENLLFRLNQEIWTGGAKRLYYRSDRNTYSNVVTMQKFHIQVQFITKKCQRRKDILYVCN